MPIPLHLQADRSIFIEQDVKIKDALADKEQRGLIKRCVCGLMIGLKYPLCGICLSKKKAQNDAKEVSDKMMYHEKKPRSGPNKNKGKANIKK